MPRSNYKQFFFVKTLYSWAIYIFNAYYLTFIFAQTGDPIQVIMNILFTYISGYFGLVAGNVIMGKLGVEKTLRLSFLLFVITGLIGIFLVDTPYNSYILVSIMRGLSGGMYWAAMNFMDSAGIKGGNRSKLYSMAFSSSTIFSVVAPIALGAILNFFASYVAIYLIFSIMCIVGVAYPYDFHIIDDKELTIKEFKKVFHSVKFDSFSHIKVTSAIAWVSNWIVASLIPFIVLGNELNMGIFLAVTALISGIISYWSKGMDLNQKAKWGELMLLFTVIASIPIIFNITFWNLFLYSVVSSITAAILTPVEQDMDAQASTIVVRSKDALTEVIVTQETMYFLGRLITLALVLIALQLFSLDLVLQALIVVMLLFRGIRYLLSEKFLHLNRKR